MLSEVERGPIQNIEALDGDIGHVGCVLPLAVQFRVSRGICYTSESFVSLTLLLTYLTLIHGLNVGEVTEEHYFGCVAGIPGDRWVQFG